MSRCPTCGGVPESRGDYMLTAICECSPCADCEKPVRPEHQIWLAEDELSGKLYCPLCAEKHVSAIVDDFLGKPWRETTS